jgi:hypothetical protein
MRGAVDGCRCLTWLFRCQVDIEMVARGGSRGPLFGPHEDGSFEFAGTGL